MASGSAPPTMMKAMLTTVEIIQNELDIRPGEHRIDHDVNYHEPRDPHFSRAIGESHKPAQGRPTRLRHQPRSL